jgi:choline dehydrogenase-like flavoprotein
MIAWSMLIGVYGENDGIDQCTELIARRSIADPEAKARRTDGKEGREKARRARRRAHRAVLSQPLDWQEPAQGALPQQPEGAGDHRQGHDDALACFWATHCVRGCSIRANFQSTTVLLPPALATDNLDIITDAMVREVMMDASGKATGVHYIDKKTRRDAVAVKARVVIVAASACETARILLNSKSRDQAGLANSSGTSRQEPHGQRGHQPRRAHPRDGRPAAVTMKMARVVCMSIRPGGWRIITRSASRVVITSRWAAAADARESAFASSTAPRPACMAASSRKKRRRYYGASFSFAGRGEMVPNKDCYCELDPKVVDQWGIPVLRFNWKWSDHEIKQASTCSRPLPRCSKAWAVKPNHLTGRDAIKRQARSSTKSAPHAWELRLGSSVTNQYCQTWDVKNLFLMDGAVLPSNPDKNPTLTILALAWRSCEYLMDAMKRGDV